jgi:RNA polymerase sigma factor (sigma-70 family)
MAAGAMSMVIQRLQSHFGPAAELTDGELLARFLESREEDALAALVRRHAPMVWGVCCRLLTNHHDAEDAFQATFLVLVRKGTDVPRQAVANWLYGVARQTAVRLRALAAKRRRRETQVVNMPEPNVAEVRNADLLAILDEELSRLPDHYRGVIVLCDLEGMTRKKAAQQLGIAEGSVASRLARARALLAKRLAQRGVVFSGSVAAVLSAGSASGFAPPALVACTIKAASLLAAGQTIVAVSATVAALTEGMVKSMLVTKIKSVLAVVLVVGLALGGIGTGVGFFTNPAAVAQDKGSGKAQPDKSVDGDALKRAEADVKQAQAVVEAAKANLEQAQANYQYRKEVLEKFQELYKKAKEAKQLSKTDQERMIGNWFITNDDSGRKGEMWVITEDTILMHAKNLGVNAELYFHRVDAGKTPKQMDITVKKVKGQTVGVIKGIYVLDGDELRLFLGVRGKDRPAAFPEKPKQGEVLVLHRGAQTKADDAPKADPPAQPKKQPEDIDREKLIGGWHIVNADSKRKGEPWNINKERLFMYANRGGFSPGFVYRLNAGKNPKHIDLSVTEKGGVFIKGIYALEGDELRICLAPKDKDRPTEFASKPGAAEFLILHRLGKAKLDLPAAKNEEKQEMRLKVLIDQVLTAHGGEDRLHKLQFTMTVKHSNGYINQYFIEPPKKLRWETTFPNQTAKRIVILFPEGRRWWTKEPNEEAKGFIPTGIEAPLKFWHDYVNFFGPRQVLRLKDADHKVALLDEEAKIGDRAAVGVQITGPLCTQKMYFDKETHLLLKGVGSDIVREVTFSDYKKFDGIPIAQKEHDGHFEPVVTDFRVVEKFDAKLFEQP